MITLTNITQIDLYIYRSAMTLEQPFSLKDLMAKINMEHPKWEITLIRYRCSKFRKQKMLKRTGFFRFARYSCLLTENDLEKAVYVFTPPVDVRNNPFACTL